MSSAPHVLVSNSYGKAEVRLLFVDRSTERHQVRDLTVTVTLDGDFDRAYTDGDNSTTLSTDAIKNTVHALAPEQLRGATLERFAVAIGERMLAAVPAARQASILVEETPWDRLGGWGHAFEATAPDRPTGGAVLARDEEDRTWGGWSNVRLLKTTGSAFGGFHRDEYSTMADIADRVFAPVLDIRWDWNAAVTDHDAKRLEVRAVLAGAFAQHDASQSAQHSLYVMAQAALDACPDIDNLSIRWPGRLHMPVDLTAFGQENRSEVYVPVDGMPGFVEACVARGA